MSVELIEVVPVQVPVGGGFDDWLAEHRLADEQLELAGAARDAQARADEDAAAEQLGFSSAPHASRGVRPNDQFAPPGALVLESSHRAWHSPPRDAPYTRPLDAHTGGAHDDIDERVDQLLLELEQDRLAYDEELRPAQHAGVYESGALGSTGYPRPDAAAPPRPPRAAPAPRRVPEVDASPVRGAASLRYEASAQPRLVRRALTHRTSPPASRAAPLRPRSARAGWDASIGQPLKEQADRTIRREQWARHRAIAVSNRLVLGGGEDGVGGGGLVILREQLAQLQNQLRAEAEREGVSDALFRAQLRRLGRLQAEAGRLAAQSAAQARTHSAQVGRQVLQEELEALLHDLNIDVPDDLDGFSPARTGPVQPPPPPVVVPPPPPRRSQPKLLVPPPYGGLRGRTQRARSAPRRVRVQAATSASGGSSSRVRRASPDRRGSPPYGGADGAHAAEAEAARARRRAEEAGGYGGGYGAGHSVQSEEDEITPKRTPPHSAKAQAASEAELRAIRAELAELRGALGERLESALWQMQAQAQARQPQGQGQAQREEEEATRRGRAPSHAASSTRGSPAAPRDSPAGGEAADVIGASGPPSASARSRGALSAAQGRDPGLSIRTPGSSAAGAASPAGTSTHQSPRFGEVGASARARLCGARCLSPPCLLRAHRCARAAVVSRARAPARARAQPSILDTPVSAEGGAEATPGLYTAEGQGVVRRMLQLIDQAQAHEQQMAEKWREAWKVRTAHARPRRRPLPILTPPPPCPPLAPRRWPAGPRRRVRRSLCTCPSTRRRTSPRCRGSRSSDAPPRRARDRALSPRAQLAAVPSAPPRRPRSPRRSTGPRRAAGRRARGDRRRGCRWTG